jgi:glycosyltransferase involved in cell wall biosynthesis
MSDSPTISVVVATYNRGERIGRTLKSILDQTRQPDEIIVVDDGSTDATAAWIRNAFPTVKVLSFPNGGTSVARNRGAAAAKGTLLAFLDHDDEMLPHALETLVRLLETFPSARAAYADHSLEDVTSGHYWPNHHSQDSFARMRAVRPIAADGPARLYDTALHDALLWGNFLQQPWLVYREPFLVEGGFDPEIRYCEDWELYLRVCRRHPVVLTDTVIARHFIEGENLHQVAGQEIQHKKVLRKHIALAPMLSKMHWVLRRRLALYYKGEGDAHRQRGESEAWYAYARAFTAWPFDYVVAVRLLLWAPSALVPGFQKR